MRLGQIVSLLAVLIAFPAAADTLNVCNKTESTLSFVDLDSGKEVVRRKTGRSPHEIALSADGKRAVVVSYIEEGHVGEELNVFEVATAMLTKTIPISPHQAPHGIVWIGDGPDVLATTEKSHDVIKVDIDAGFIPIRIQFQPDGKAVAVADLNGGRVVVFDSESRQQTASIGLSTMF